MKCKAGYTLAECNKKFSPPCGSPECDFEEKTPKAYQSYNEVHGRKNKKT